jgi:hypothetical protein
MKRPSAPLAISLVALFFSLGGAGLAATKYIITSPSQIKPSVIDDLRGHQGARGEQGPAGPQGPAGQPGANGTQGPPGATGSFNPTLTKGGPLQTTADVANFSGDPLAVTMTQIVDPATGANEFYTPNPGYRFVAVEMTLQNASNATITDDANTDVTVIGTDSQAYVFDADDVSECTNFSYGDYTLLSGNSEDGCVVFQLPTGVSVQAIQFALNGNNADTAQWSASG